MNLSIETNAMQNTPFELPLNKVGLNAGTCAAGGRGNIWPAGSGPLRHSASIRNLPQQRTLHPSGTCGRAPTDLNSEFSEIAYRDTQPDEDVIEGFVERMLADPMTHLVMAADGVTEAEVMILYRKSQPANPLGRSQTNVKRPHQRGPFIVEAGPQPGSARPGIGE